MLRIIVHVASYCFSFNLLHKTNFRNKIKTQRCTSFAIRKKDVVSTKTSLCVPSERSKLIMYVLKSIEKMSNLKQIEHTLQTTKTYLVLNVFSVVSRKCKNLNYVLFSLNEHFNSIAINITRIALFFKYFLVKIYKQKRALS